MTQKDYIKFANMLKKLRQELADNTGAIMADKVSPYRLLDRFEDDISKILQTDNRKFDLPRFIKAANL